MQSVAVQDPEPGPAHAPASTPTNTPSERFNSLNRNLPRLGQVTATLAVTNNLLTPPFAGGHTAEMMRLLDSLPLSRQFSRRTYLIAAGDSLSLQKALALEQTIGSGSVSSPLTSGLARVRLLTPSPSRLRHPVRGAPHPARALRPPVLPHLPLHHPALPCVLPLARCPGTAPAPSRSEGRSASASGPSPAERTWQLRANRARGLPAKGQPIAIGCWRDHMTDTCFDRTRSSACPRPS